MPLRTHLTTASFNLHFGFRIERLKIKFWRLINRLTTNWELKSSRKIIRRKLIRMMNIWSFRVCFETNKQDQGNAKTKICCSTQYLRLVIIPVRRLSQPKSYQWVSCQLLRKRINQKVEARVEKWSKNIINIVMKTMKKKHQPRQKNRLILITIPFQASLNLNRDQTQGVNQCLNTEKRKLLSYRDVK